MNGKHLIKIADRRVKYTLELVRNITVIQGDSGTGKTTLFDMVSAYSRLKERSGVQIQCDKSCTALYAESDWETRLRNLSDSIIFIDEDAEYVGSREFAAAIRDSDNYYVIFSRQPLHELPYSVEEVYEIKTSGKFHKLQKRYRSGKGYVYAKATGRGTASVLLTEDSHAGYQLYDQHYSGSKVSCISAGSNTGIYAFLREHHQEKVFVIADGAAFGAEMERVLKLQQQFPDKITLCLPESFEWLILQSGLIEIAGLREMLENPSDFIESGQFFSWEQFFTDYLIRHTAGTYYAYSKSKLQGFYLLTENRNRILALIMANMPKPVKKE